MWPGRCWDQADSSGDGGGCSSNSANGGAFQWAGDCGGCSSSAGAGAGAGGDGGCCCESAAAHHCQANPALADTGRAGPSAVVTSSTAAVAKSLSLQLSVQNSNISVTVQGTSGREPPPPTPQSFYSPYPGACEHESCTYDFYQPAPCHDGPPYQPHAQASYIFQDDSAPFQYCPPAAYAGPSQATGFSCERGSGIATGAGDRSRPETPARHSSLSASGWVDGRGKALRRRDPGRSEDYPDFQTEPPAKRVSYQLADRERHLGWEAVPRTPGATLEPPGSPDVVCLDEDFPVAPARSSHALASVTPRAAAPPFRPKRQSFESAPRTPRLDLPPPTPRAPLDIQDLTEESPETIDLSQSSTYDELPSPGAPSPPDVIELSSSPSGSNRTDDAPSSTSTPPCRSIGRVSTVPASPPALRHALEATSQHRPPARRTLFAAEAVRSSTPLPAPRRRPRSTPATPRPRVPDDDEDDDDEVYEVVSSSVSVEELSKTTTVTDEIEEEGPRKSKRQRTERASGDCEEGKQRIVVPVFEISSATEPDNARKSEGKNEIEDTTQMPTSSGKSKEYSEDEDTIQESTGSGAKHAEAEEKSEKDKKEQEDASDSQNGQDSHSDPEDESRVIADKESDPGGNEEAEENEREDNSDSEEEESKSDSEPPEDCGEGSKEEGELSADDDDDDDDDDDEDEEEEDEGGDKDASKPSGKWEHKMRHLSAKFILQEAEEGDAGDEDGDDEDGEWIDDEASEASEAAAAAAAADEALRRRAADDASWRPLRSHSPTVADIMTRLRLDPLEAADQHRAARAPQRPQVDQQALLPGIADPCLWMIKCRRAQEQHVVLSLMRKCLRLGGAASDAGASAADGPRIHAAVFSGSAPRFVYVEALRKQHARSAVLGLHALAPDRMKQVPIPEMPDVLTACRSATRCGAGRLRVQRGEWVRVARGLYRGDLGKVVDVDEQEEQATVKLLPRLDYGLMKEQAAGAGAGAGRPKRTLRRPPARRLDVDALRRNGVDVSAAPSGLLVVKRDTYKDRFLLKRFPLRSFKRSQPNLEELLAFGEDNAQGVLLGEEPEAWLGPDDRVLLCEGGLTGMRGTVVRVVGERATVRLDSARLGDAPVPCTVAELRKVFAEGDRVRVMQGAHRDATGLVVKAGADRLVLAEDATNREIEVLVRHARLEANSWATASAGGLHRGTVVRLAGDGSVAVVVRVEGACVRVLDAMDRERCVPLRTARLRSPPRRGAAAAAAAQRRRVPALDCEQNALAARDKVVAVDGAHKDKSGTVLAVQRDRVFVETCDGRERCLFAAPATHLRLQGGASDRHNMFLRQLDGLGGGGGAGAAGAGGATPQLGSPAGSPGLLPLVAPPDPRAPAPPRRPPRTPADARDFSAFDRGLQRDPFLVGCVVSVTTGPYKSCVGTVRQASRAAAQVELQAPNHTIAVQRSHLRVVEAPAGGTTPPPAAARARAAARAGWAPRAAPSAAAVGFYGSQLGLAAPPRAPASPQPLPSPAFAAGAAPAPAPTPAPAPAPAAPRESPALPGFRTPLAAAAATPMYDAGSRTPLPTPQSPAPSVAVWEPRATPTTCTSSPLGSVSSSPLGYLSVPLEFLPSAPAAPAPAAPPLDLPPAWARPGMEVTVQTAPGAREVATVRAVTGEGGVSMMLRSGVLLTLATPDHLQPAPPALGDACCVLADDGAGWGRRALLVDVVDGVDGVVTVDGGVGPEVVPLARLCRVAADYVAPQALATHS